MCTLNGMYEPTMHCSLHTGPACIASRLVRALPSQVIQQHKKQQNTLLTYEAALIYFCRLLQLAAHGLHGQSTWGGNRSSGPVFFSLF